MVEWIKYYIITSDFFFFIGAVCAAMLAELCILSYGKLSKACKVLAWIHGLVGLAVAGFFIVFEYLGWPIRISWWVWSIFGCYGWLSVIVSLVLFVRSRRRKNQNTTMVSFLGCWKAE